MVKEKWKLEEEKIWISIFQNTKLTNMKRARGKGSAPNDIMKYAFCNPIGFHVSRTIYYYNNII